LIKPEKTGHLPERDLRVQLTAGAREQGRYRETEEEMVMDRVRVVILLMSIKMGYAIFWNQHPRISQNKFALSHYESFRNDRQQTCHSFLYNPDYLR